MVKVNALGPQGIKAQNVQAVEDLKWAWFSSRVSESQGLKDFKWARSSNRVLSA